MPDLAIPYTLAEAGRQFLQGALCLLLLSTPLLGASLLLAYHLRRRGNFTTASTIQRLSLVGLIAGSLLFACFTYAGNPFGSQTTRTAPPPSFPSAPAVSIGLPSVGASGQVWIPAAHPAPVLPDLSGWYVGLTLVWAGGSSLLLLGLALSYGYLARFWLQARPLPPGSPVTQNFATLLAVSDWAPSRKAAVLLTHPRVTIPFAARLPLLPPAIFLPSDPTLVLTEEALSAVLAHELSHLLRNDPGWNLLLRIAWAALWPQPLLWRQLHQMSTIQELACDQTALHLTRDVCRPHVFATSLVNLAERHLFPVWMSQATASMACHRPLIEERVHHIMATEKASASSVATRRLSLSARLGLVAGAAVALGVSLGGVARLSSAAALPTVPLAAAQADSPATPLLDLDLRDTPLIDSLTLAFRLAGLRCEIDPALRPSGRDVGYVTVRCTQVPLPQALNLILRSASRPGKIAYRIDGKVAHVFPAEVGADGLPTKRTTQTYARNTPLNTALAELFAGTGFVYDPFSVDPTTTTHARLNQTPFHTALETLLRNASKPLTYRIDPARGAVSISPVLPPAPPPVIIPGDENGAGLPNTPITVEWKDAPLRNALEQLFQTTRQDFSIDNAVRSELRVTGRWENQPIRVVLPAMLRQSSVPLVYTVHNGVIVIRPRP